MKNCKICGSSNLKLKFQTPSVPLAGILLFDVSEPYNNYTTDVYRCEKCGHIQLIDTIPDEVYKNYLYTPSNSRGFNEHIEWLTKDLITKFDPKKIIEVGSANGKLLSSFKKKGCEVLGYEPSIKLSEISKNEDVLTLINFFSEKTSISYDADLIIMRHVLEHITDLDDIMIAVSKSLSKNGIFVIEVPNLLNIIKENQFYAFFNEHVSYFSVKSLKYLLNKFGFKIIEIQDVSLEGGSILIYASQSYKYKETEEVEKRINEENKIINIDKFAKNTNKQIENIKSFVKKQNQKGLKIAAWGAGQRGVSLLNICKFTNKDIRYVVDVNPNYQNKLLPGCNIPVVHPDKIYQDPVDGIIIFATGYAQQIIKDTPLYNGKFITLIPNIQWKNKQSM